MFCLKWFSFIYNGIKCFHLSFFRNFFYCFGNFFFNRFAISTNWYSDIQC